MNLGTVSATFADANVGTGKTVIFSYTISGADDGDYTPIQPASISAIITPATLLITPGTQTESYGFGGLEAGTSASLGTSDFTAYVELNDNPGDLVPLYGSDSVTSVTLSTNASYSTSHNYNAGPWLITRSPSAMGWAIIRLRQLMARCKSIPWR